jgi:hypothetical protein
MFTSQCFLTVTFSADVKMLVPSFGMVMPQECRVPPAFGGCPPMLPEVCGPSADHVTFDHVNMANRAPVLATGALVC